MYPLKQLASKYLDLPNYEEEMKKNIYTLVQYTTPGNWFWYEEKPHYKSFPTYGPFKSIDAAVKDLKDRTTNTSELPSSTMNWAEACEALKMGEIIYRRDGNALYWMRARTPDWIEDAVTTVSETDPRAHWNGSCVYFSIRDLNATDWRVLN